MVLGDYEVGEVLGRGGMGTVYRGRQISLDRPVAVKVLLTEYATDQKYVGRFLREARTAAQLNHPNIVHIIDAGVCGTLYFIVMEYVDGQSLGTVLREKGRLTEEEALRWIRQAAEGLAFAHGAGIVHRDVKPDNILLTREGTAKVGDLGLAKSKPAESALTLTVSSGAMGTPWYIAPEQVRGGRDVDARADIYALGVSLYHLLSGSLPFEGRNPVVVMAQHLLEAMPPLRSVAPHLPRGILDLVDLMTAKKPEERIQTMSEVVDVIGEVIANPNALVRVASGSIASRRVARRRRRLALAIGIPVLVVLVAAVFWPKPGPITEETRRAGAIPQKVSAPQSRRTEDVGAGSQKQPYEYWKRVLEKTEILKAMERNRRTLQQNPDGTLNLNLFQLSIKDITPLAGMPLKRLDLSGARIEDLTPLKGMPLEWLCLIGASIAHKDFSPLKGERAVTPVKLKSLNIAGCGVKDLSSLEGLPLIELNLQSDPVRDLTPLKGMKLENLNLANCRDIADLSPLKGMPLTTLNFANAYGVKDLAPLQGMPLKKLVLTASRVRDLSPLEGTKLEDLDLLGSTELVDIRALKGVPLKRLCLTGCDKLRDANGVAELAGLESLVIPAHWKGGKLDALRRHPTLRELSYSKDERTPVEEFWKEVDDQKK
jgi:serine/threonine-protein kinase